MRNLALAGIFKWKLHSQHLLVGPFITWSAVLSVGSNNNNIQLSEKEIKFQILSPYRECLLVAPLIKILSTSERKLNQGGRLPSPLSPPMNKSARTALIYWGKEWFPRGKKCIWNESTVSLQSRAEDNFYSCTNVVENLFAKLPEVLQISHVEEGKQSCSGMWIQPGELTRVAGNGGMDTD